MDNEKIISFEDYRRSGGYDADSIDALNRQLGEYTTDYDALKHQAEVEYAPTYRAQQDALDDRLSEQTRAAQAERRALTDQYERQRRQTDARYDQSAAALNNTLNARGLGRSSLTATQGAYLEGQRGQALADINRAESDEINAINSRIAQYTEEAARNRQSLAESYAQQLENRINTLRDANRNAAASLRLQIAALQQQGYEAYRDWLMKERAQQLDEAEFQQKYGLNKTAGSAQTRQKTTGGGQTAKSGGTAASTSSLAGVVKGLASGLSGVVSGLADAAKNLFSKAKNSAGKGLK